MLVRITKRGQHNLQPVHVINPKGIKIWLITQDLTVTDVARAANLALSIVSSTIHMHRNNQRVIKQLLALGCPEEFFISTKDRLAEQQRLERITNGVARRTDLKIN